MKLRNLAKIETAIPWTLGTNSPIKSSPKNNSNSPPSMTTNYNHPIEGPIGCQVWETEPKVRQIGRQIKKVDKIHRS